MIFLQKAKITGRNGNEGLNQGNEICELMLNFEILGTIVCKMLVFIYMLLLRLLLATWLICSLNVVSEVKIERDEPFPLLEPFVHELGQRHVPPLNLQLGEGSVRHMQGYAQCAL